MEEPGGLQSMGSLRVGHNWASSLSLFPFTHWRRKWQPTPVFLPGESQGWGSLVAAVCGITQSRTWLKWLSSSSSRHSVGVRELDNWCGKMICSWYQKIHIFVVRNEVRKNKHDCIVTLVWAVAFFFFAFIYLFFYFAFSKQSQAVCHGSNLKEE